MVEVKLAPFACRFVSTAFALAVSVCSASAFAGTTHRPISDFLSTQGTFSTMGRGGCTIFVPPTPNFVGFTDTVHDLGISFDYAGLSDQPLGGALGTSFSGSSPSGRSRTAAWSSPSTSTPRTRSSTSSRSIPPARTTSSAITTCIFGARVTDVQAGAQPALGDCTMDFVFTNSAPGLPIPDFEQLLFAPETGQNILSVIFEGTASGQFASGGTGKVHVIERGILKNGFHGAWATASPPSSSTSPSSRSPIAHRLGSGEVFGGEALAAEQPRGLREPRQQPRIGDRCAVFGTPSSSARGTLTRAAPA